MTQVVVMSSALGSALAAAGSTVLQHRTARHAPQKHAAGVRLLAHLVARPAWLVGLLLAAIGLGLHTVALTGGRLAVVQPLLVCGLLFALPLSMLLENRRPSHTELAWAGALVAALTIFLLVARPSAGVVSIDADVLGWTTAAGSTAIAIASLCAFRFHRYRAVLLATASGVGYGIAAALLKQTTAIAAGGILAVVVDWPVYALIIVGAVAVALTQLAYRAGPLRESLPPLTIADPATSIMIGALAFHEQLAHSAAAIVIELAAFVVMGIASAQLAR